MTSILRKHKMCYKIYVYILCVIVQSLSHVQDFATPRTVAQQAPLSMGFSRQEYWSRLPFPSPGDLPDTGIDYNQRVVIFFFMQKEKSDSVALIDV